MESDRQSPDNDHLERLLRQARWPEPRFEQLARLSADWRELLQRRRRRLYSGALVAASVLVAAGLLASPKLHPNPRTAKLDATREIAQREPDVPAVEFDPGGGSVEVRAANLYEQLLLSSATASSRPERLDRTRVAADDALLNELIAALAADPQADVAGRLDSLSRRLGRHERALWSAARDGNLERRVGATRLLSRIGTVESLGILLELADAPATHEAAIAGLCRLASAPVLARRASSEPTAGLRVTLLAALLERQTEESVGLFLDFVNDPALRSDALAAVTATGRPPVDVLCRFLEDPRKPSRLAAAQALAQLPDAEVADRLCVSVERGIGRQEALIALLLSSSAQAADCLSRARRDLYLVASVQAAEQEIQFLSNSERR